MKNVFLWLWMKWEKLYEKIAGIVYISDENIFRIALKRYHGKNIKLSDGTLLKKGDKYIELHLNNELAASVLKDISPLSMLKWVKSSLYGLAQFVKDEPYVSADVMMGLTIFGIKGIERFGFEVVELNKVESVLISMYESFLYAIFRGRTKALYSKSQAKKLKARRILMSRKVLLELYGDAR